MTQRIEHEVAHRLGVEAGEQSPLARERAVIVVLRAPAGAERITQAGISRGDCPGLQGELCGGRHDSEGAPVEVSQLHAQRQQHVKHWTPLPTTSTTRPLEMPMPFAGASLTNHLSDRPHHT